MALTAIANFFHSSKGRKKKKPGNERFSSLTLLDIDAGVDNLEPL